MDSLPPVVLEQVVHAAQLLAKKCERTVHVQITPHAAHRYGHYK